MEEKFPRNFSATEIRTAYHVLFRKMSLQDTILERSYRTQSLEYRLAFTELISIEKALKFDLRLDFGFKGCFDPICVLNRFVEEMSLLSQKSRNNVELEFIPKQTIVDLQPSEMFKDVMGRQVLRFQEMNGPVFWPMMRVRKDCCLMLLVCYLRTEYLWIPLNKFKV